MGNAPGNSTLNRGYSLAWFRNLNDTNRTELIVHLSKSMVAVQQTLRQNNEWVDTFFYNEWISSRKELSTNLHKLTYSGFGSYWNAYRLICKRMVRWIEKTSKLQNQVLSAEKMDSIRRDFLVIVERSEVLLAKSQEREKNGAATTGTAKALDGLTFSNPSKELPPGFDGVTPFNGVNVKIRRLKELHGLAVDCYSSSEDKYFLEQVVRNYIPVIVSGANGVKFATPEVQSDAEAQFMTQLELISNKLTSIIDEAGRRTLQQVEVQTNFLTASLSEGPQNPLLRLVPRDKLDDRKTGS